MKNTKFTVLKVETYDDLIKEYADEGVGPCPFHKVGDEFLSVGGAKPEGLCECAWSALSKYAFAFAHGTTQFWPGTWVKEPGVVIGCCDDGLRPVVFKLEAVDAE